MTQTFSYIVLKALFIFCQDTFVNQIFKGAGTISYQLEDV